MKKKTVLALALAAALALASCSVTVGGGSGSAPEGTAESTPELTEAAKTPEEYTASGATRFEFSGSGITAKDGEYKGYKIEGTALTVKESGTYVLSGKCENGSVTVKKEVKGVTLVLDGLELTASATAAITCGKSSEVRIFAAEGSVNTLADDKYNNDDVYTDENKYPNIENAVIKCKDGSSVTLCGTGTLNITANGKNGIKGGADVYKENADGSDSSAVLSKAVLTVKETTLNVTANVNDGIKSDSELDLLSGKITVSAADDGIKSGYVMNIGASGADGPEIEVVKAKEGAEAATLNVYSGTLRINATDDGANAANSDLNNYAFSYNQYGGYVYINVTNGDGIDSNGTINLCGGTLEVFSPAQGDGDPLDSGSGTSFKGATVLAVGHLGMPQGYSAETPYVVFGSGTAVSFGGGRTGRGGYGGSAAQTALVTAGSEITVCGEDGGVLYTSKALRDASYVLFSSPALVSGKTCTLKNGGTETAQSEAGTASTAGMNFPGGQGGDPGQGGFPDQGGFPGGNPGQGGQGGFPGQGGLPGQGGFPGGQGGNGEMPTPPEGGFSGEGFPGGGEFPGSGEFPGDGEFPGEGGFPEPPDGYSGATPAPPENEVSF